ncbi:MAG TPA: aminoacetone oxidase family FAD-binding enzyme, partial [Gillisia sp.]|nr:aminoacetone oxidase family FAD-binding enzyme [Gillisia sp.]
IINCFLDETQRLGIKILKHHAVQELLPKNESWEIITTNGSFLASKVLVATGSNPKMWEILKSLGHTIEPAVPSLFTFNIKDERIKDLPGLSTKASVKVVTTNLRSEGPLLITHWGMSGPAILKLSAWGARELNDMAYKFQIRVNWLPGYSQEDLSEDLTDLKLTYRKQHISKNPHFGLPKRLWKSLVKASDIPDNLIWADMNKNQIKDLSLQLTAGIFEVNGKSTFKEEFVTAGGIDLKEVNFKTFGSRIQKNLFFAGEILNIDAITGGFNFQNAWTGGYIAAKAMTTENEK